MIAEIIYFLSFITASLCAFLLLKNYFKTRMRLLLWTGLCFVGLALNNGMVIVDFILFEEWDLSVQRVLPAFIGLGVLVVGLVWDAPR